MNKVDYFHLKMCSCIVITLFFYLKKNKNSFKTYPYLNHILLRISLEHQLQTVTEKTRPRFLLIKSKRHDQSQNPFDTYKYRLCEHRSCVYAVLLLDDSN